MSTRIEPKRPCDDTDSKHSSPLLLAVGTPATHIVLYKQNESTTVVVGVMQTDEIPTHTQTVEQSMWSSLSFRNLIKAWIYRDTLAPRVDNNGGSVPPYCLLSGVCPSVWSVQRAEKRTVCTGNSGVYSTHHSKQQTLLDFQVVTRTNVTGHSMVQVGKHQINAHKGQYRRTENK